MTVVPASRAGNVPRPSLLHDSFCRGQVPTKVFQAVNHSVKKRKYQRHRSSSGVVVRATAAPVAFQSVDESVWDERYANAGPLQYGVASYQGPREDMEDYASIVARGRCGFLYAGTSISFAILSYHGLVSTPCVLAQAFLMAMEADLQQTT